jgi:hypothetical protein
MAVRSVFAASVPEHGAGTVDVAQGGGDTSGCAAERDW